MTLPTFDPVLSPASPQAAALSHLFVITLIVCVAIFVIVAGSLAWCLVRFGNRAAESDVPQLEGNTKLEITWTLASIVVLIVLFVLTMHAMDVSDPPAERAPDLTVIGHQWWWEVRYADGTITANEIHIPTGSDVRVRVESADVIHSFWVPELARKMDAIPGHPNELWLRADDAGDYLGTCSEFCGAQHAGMRLLVVARAPAAFRAWLSAQALPAVEPTTPAATRGARAFRNRTCASCHSIRGLNDASPTGPDLTHFATRETIAAGVLPNTRANVQQWLTDPQLIKPSCHMPDFELASTEFDELTAFLETLQ